MIDFLVEPRVHPRSTLPVEISPANPGLTDLANEWGHVAIDKVRHAVTQKPRTVLITAFLIGGALAWLTSRKQ